MTKRILVSPEDEHLLSEYKWCHHPLGYAQASVKTERGTWTVVLLHRIVMGAPDGMSVDHINGDPTDNRRENLRICSHAENMRNRRIQKNNRTGVKGVYADPSGSYRAEIKKDGEKFRLGTFKWLSDAALAYRLAAIHLHGEFARFA